MADSIALTEKETVELTGYKRPSRQETWCRENGIPSRRRGDGTIVILRRDVTGPSTTATKSAEPRLDGLARAGR